MIKKIINIGNYQYLSELYDNNDFGLLETTTSNFVMLRNFDIMNDVINDTHIFIMDKLVWKKMCEEIDVNVENYSNGFDKVTEVVFPIENTDITGYSTLYTEFNMNFTRESLYEKDEYGNIVYGNSVYEIVDENGKLKDIRCNKIKLYHPLTKRNLDGIIMIDNYMNNIHWYYLCDIVNHYPIKSETEKRENNNIYSEYIEILFPNIDDLFKLNKNENGKDIYNAYFKENLNTIISTKNENYISRIIIDEVERYYNLVFNLDNTKQIDFDNDDNDKYYLYIGSNNPIIESFDSPNKYILNPLVKYSEDLKIFETLDQFSNMVNEANISLTSQDDSYIYILIPSILEKNITISNELMIESDDETSSTVEMPMFEILCDVVYGNVVIDGIQYKVLRTNSKTKKITINDFNYLPNVEKFIYVGENNPIENGNLIDSIREEIGFKQFKLFSEIFDRYDYSLSYNYRYSQFKLSPNCRYAYVLFPSYIERTIIISNATNNFYNGTTWPMYESLFNVLNNGIVIDGVNYCLAQIDLNQEYDDLPKYLRIYNIVYKNREYDSNAEEDYENLIINDGKTNRDNFSIMNFIELKNQYVPLALLLQPYRIVEDYDPYIDDMHNVKLYIKQNLSIENNYLTKPFNLTIYPFSYVDSTTGQYIFDDTLGISTTTYNTENRFVMRSKLGFNEENHKISLISNFDYPKKESYLREANGDTGLALREAYKYFNNISEDIYKYYWVNLFLINYEDQENKYLKAFDNLYNNKKIDEDQKWYVNIDITNDKGKIETKRYYQLFQYDEFDDVEDLSQILDKEKLRRLISINYDGLWSKLKDWEIEEEYQTNMDFFGFRVQVATDTHFRNLIYNQTFSIDFEELDDFSFEINNIFKSWNELPELLVCKTMFIDHILNRIIIGNNVIINKEYFKYLVNEDNVYCINTLNFFNNDMIKEINAGANIAYNRSTIDIVKDLLSILNTTIHNDEETIDSIVVPEELDDSVKENISMLKTNYNNIKNNFDTISQKFNELFPNDKKISGFNFINNINCIVNKEVDNSNSFSSGQKNQSTKILYQPIFYRTQDLQNIKLRSNITQNIGINLSQYMSKVEAFKIIIDNLEFVESGRNDVYVIFKINTNLLQTNSGNYNIINENDEYISSGSWSTY